MPVLLERVASTTNKDVRSRCFSSSVLIDERLRTEYPACSRAFPAGVCPGSLCNTKISSLIGVLRTREEPIDTRPPLIVNTFRAYSIVLSRVGAEYRQASIAH